MAATPLSKGYRLEELLRAYFIRAGVYAVRGVPLQLDGDDLTDVDLWLYERPTGSSRRRQIVDAKSKLKPKAIERLLWTKGLYELLEVDGAYIATSDTRPSLKEMSRRLGVLVLDGSDIKRMSESDKIAFPARLHEEDIDNAIRATDKSRRNKELQNGYQDLKSSLIDHFGSGTVNRALDHFSRFSNLFTSSHPNGSAAEICLRLSYIAASITAIALDATLTKVSFKSAEERRKTLLNVVRYGDDDEIRGLAKVRVAVALVEQYAPNGRSISQTMLNSIRRDYDKIPAEIIADYVLNHLKSDGLFRMARSLEMRAFNNDVIGFDGLNADEKAFIGVLQDFAGSNRLSFAKNWTAASSHNSSTSPASSNDSSEIGPLFED